MSTQSSSENTREGGLKVTKEELSPERGKTKKSRVRRRGRESLAIAIVSPH